MGPIVDEENGGGVRIVVQRTCALAGYCPDIDVGTDQEIAIIRSTAMNYVRIINSLAMREVSKSSRAVFDLTISISTFSEKTAIWQQSVFS